MKEIRQKRKIINRLELTEAARALLDVDEIERVGALLACYRVALETGFAEVRQRFEKDHDGSQIGRAHV